MTGAAEAGGGEALYQVVDGAIAVVTLNRPEARNAVNVAMAQMVERLVRQVEADPTIRAAVLTSADPRAFCAGADLKDVAAGRGPLLAPEPAGFAGFVFAERAKPWIAATEGQTLGGGLELALACDMIVASKAAAFGLPEVQRGLYAGAGGTFRLASRLPRNIALELVVTGGRLGAVRAAELGLVNRLTAPGGALAGALELARLVAANGPLAVRESLRIARLASDEAEAGLRVASEQASDIVMTSAEAREGVEAFAQKRKPVWGQSSERHDLPRNA